MQYNIFFFIDIISSMGQFQTVVAEPVVTRQKDLIVATLNYCGIAFSPFQFYFKGQKGEYYVELQEISQIFRKLIPQYIPNFDERSFKWQTGKIEKFFKKGRYSNMFDLEVGIFWGRFISRKSFEEKWDIQFEHHRGELKFEWKKEQKQTVRLYDFIMYHTLLNFVYKQENFEKAIQNDPKEFLKRLKPFYQISFLNEERKLDKFMASLLTLKSDVFFIQEYSERLLLELQLSSKFHVTIDPRQDSLVLLNKQSFGKIREFKEVTAQINEQQKKGLRWAESIAVVGADNFIFACVHLSSGKQKNKSQVANLKQDLLKLRQALPKQELIVGGDINSFMQSDAAFGKKFHLYPRYEYEFTTLKKRTFAQGQFHKAQEEVKESKDRIISTLNIAQGDVQFLDGTKAEALSYLPTHEHPHDHLLVVTRLSSNK